MKEFYFAEIVHFPTVEQKVSLKLQPVLLINQVVAMTLLFLVEFQGGAFPCGASAELALF